MKKNLFSDTVRDRKLDFKAWGAALVLRLPEPPPLRRWVGAHDRWTCGLPKDRHILMSHICKYVSSHDKRDFVDMIKLRI